MHVRVAVLGLGYWGPNIARNLAAIDGCSQVVVYDLDADRRAAAERQHPGAEAATSLEAIWADPTVEAVVIVTPVTTHAELATQALEAGKHVLVEKPFAISSADARRLVDLATQRGRVLMAGHTFLYSPPVRLVHRLIREGRVGTPLYAQSTRMNLGVHQSDVSVLWDLAPHDLSILVDWLGELPTRVSAIGRATHGTARADVAFVDLVFPSGCIASLHLSWLAPTKVRRTTLVGTQRMIVYEDTNGDEPVKVYDKGLEMPDPEDFGQHRLTYRTGDVLSPHVDVVEPLRAELQDFLMRISKGELPDEREDTAVEIVRTIEAAERSLESGGEPVRL